VERHVGKLFKVVDGLFFLPLQTPPAGPDAGTGKVQSPQD